MLKDIDIKSVLIGIGLGYSLFSVLEGKENQNKSFIAGLMIGWLGYKYSQTSGKNELYQTNKPIIGG